MPINSGEATTLGEQAVGQSTETSKGGYWGYNNNNGGCGGLLIIFVVLVIVLLLLFIFL